MLVISNFSKASCDIWLYQNFVRAVVSRQNQNDQSLPTEVLKPLPAKEQLQNMSNLQIFILFKTCQNYAHVFLFLELNTLGITAAMSSVWLLALKSFELKHG